MRRTLDAVPRPGWDTEETMRWLLTSLALTFTAVLLPTPAEAQAPVDTVVIDHFVVYRVQYGYSFRGDLDRARNTADDGSRVELWAFEGTAGDCVAISMTSQSF